MFNVMENERKRYFVNLIEMTDEGRMTEVMNFNFGGHHDLADMVENAKTLGFTRDEYAKEFVLAMRFMHHVIKKNSDNPIFAEFATQFEDFKRMVSSRVGERTNA